jgi:hypothetical protein
MKTYYRFDIHIPFTDTTIEFTVWTRTWDKHPAWYIIQCRQSSQQLYDTEKKVYAAAAALSKSSPDETITLRKCRDESDLYLKRSQIAPCQSVENAKSKANQEQICESYEFGRDNRR